MTECKGTRKRRPRSDEDASGYRGVSKVTTEVAGEVKFRAQVYFEKTVFYVGTFEDAFEAAVAFDLVCTHLKFPDEALNFPDARPGYTRQALTALRIPQKLRDFLGERGLFDTAAA